MMTPDPLPDTSEFDDTPAEEHDEIAADEDAREADDDAVGAVGVIPGPNSPAGVVLAPEDDPVDHRRD